MVKLINAHCHLLNYQYISPECFRSRSIALAFLVRHRRTRPVVRTIAAIMPKRKLHRLHELYDIMEMDIDRVADSLRQEMDMAGIQLAVPLMVDLGRAAFTVNPRIPFAFQVKQISDISLKHLGVIMPSVMVDPRRPRAADMLIRSLEEMGFLGVKMYPALGYHPDPDSIYNEPQTNDELRKIYSYCESGLVPITTHCSPGGAYSDDILKVKAVRCELTKPSAWEGVLSKFPRLHLDLAHFGQDMIHMKNPDSWAGHIRDLMYKYPGVHTDLAYNEHALLPKTSRRYFEVLNNIIDSDPVVKERVLFGTDWNMTRHTWREVDYVAPFRRWLDDRKLNKIAFENSLNFLFPERKFPKRLESFLKMNGRNLSELPKWMPANLSFGSAGV